MTAQEDIALAALKSEMVAEQLVELHEDGTLVTSFQTEVGIREFKVEVKLFDVTEVAEPQAPGKETTE